MLEVRTTRFPRNVLDRVLHNARQIEHYKPVEKGKQSVNIMRSELPSLAHLTFLGKARIYVEHEGTFPLSEFWHLLQETNLGDCPTEGAVVNTTLGFNESGRAFDSTTQSDFDLTFGQSVYGLSIGALLGDVSLGREDLAYRQRLFNDFIAALGLKGSLETVEYNGELRLEVKDEAFVFLDRLSSKERKEVLNKQDLQGNRFPHLVRTHSSTSRNTNFTDLHIYEFDFETLRTKVRDVATLFGGSDRVNYQRLSASFAPSTYESLRGTFNATEIDRWSIRYRAMIDYSPDDIDELISGRDYVGAKLFSFEPPSIGHVDADMNYEEGRFSMTFTCEYESNEQEEALQQLIVDLAGEDIVDRTLI